MRGSTGKTPERLLHSSARRAMLFSISSRWRGRIWARHPSVMGFMDALDKPLADLGFPSELTRIERILAALYECLAQSFSIHYESEPRSYPDDWQKIRFHSRVLREHQAHVSTSPCCGCMPGRGVSQSVADPFQDQSVLD